MPAPHGAFERIDEHHSHVRGQDDSKGGPALVRRTKEMRYVSLHHHSTFSFLDGYGLPESHVRRATELGMPALAMTEHGNVSSHVKLEQSSLKAGIKPIFGVELYTGSVSEEKRSRRKNHLTLLAETEGGYRNLLRLVSRGWDEGFYFEPTVSGPMLAEHSDGLVVLSGCQGSLLATSLVGGKNIEPADASYHRARRVAQAFQSELNGNYYLEVQAFPELEKACTINQAYEQLSNELSIPLVATGDCHYTQPSESEMQMVLHNVRPGEKRTLEEMANAWGYDVPLSPPVSDAVMFERLRGTGLSRKAAEQAIYSAAEIAQRCNVTLPKLPPLRFPLPAGVADTRKFWVEKLREGWKYRGIDKLPWDRQMEYRKRLKYERSIIEEKDYVDYFLVVADLVVFAKTVGIPVGPARGSAAASLACYLLRITEVDPLRFPNLVFERFIDLTRQDLPDVDLDFDDERRREVRDYLVAKYGAACVGNLGTFTAYKSKLALDDVARVHRIPQWEVDQIKDLLIERSSGDLRADATIEDTVEYFEKAAAVVKRHPELKKAYDLEGQYKGLGVHAAGLVVANGPLNDACATYIRTVGKKKHRTEVVSVDKYDAEHLNILKMDLLGLNTMGMIRRCLEQIGMTLEELYALPLDDETVIDGFRRNDVVGVFQFDGRAMRSVNGELQPDTFAEICDVNALARPGPLHSGATSEYVDAKRGRKQPTRLHPMLDAICETTHYQIVYQEQILRTVREIGNFDWTHAAYIRKIISKKIGEQEFNRQWERFLVGALENGLEEDTARAIWNTCITAGSYAFNAAHCVSYGMIAYWTMWLKQYHPEAFYAAALTKYEKKKLELLRDANAFGRSIDIRPPDPRHSGLDWTVEDGGIRGGLTEIPGIGDAVAQAILSYRDEHGITDPSEICNIKGIGKAKLAAVEGVLASDDPFQVYALDRTIAKVKAEIRAGKLGRLPQTTHQAIEVPYSKDELDTEVVWLGIITSRNLRDLFELHYSRTGEELDPSSVRDSELREYVTMNGQDETEMLTVSVDRWKYPALRDAIWGIKLNHDLVLVRGVKKGYQARRAVYVHQIWVIDPEDGEDDDSS